MLLNCLTHIAWKKVGLFTSGVLFGTAGFKILGSEDAKKLYTECTAAVIRCKDCILEQKDIIVENCSDIYAEAQDINERRNEKRREREYAEARALLDEEQANAEAEA